MIDVKPKPALLKIFRGLANALVEVDAESVLDAVWLSATLPTLASSRESTPVVHSTASIPPDDSYDDHNVDDSENGESPPESDNSQPSTTNLHAPGSCDGTLTRRGDEYKLPRVPALQQSLQLERGLRSLSRPVASSTEVEIDEIETATASAEARRLELRFRPKKVRGLSATIVVERSPTMRFWNDQTSEIRSLFWRTGAFQRLETVFLNSFLSPPKMFRDPQLERPMSDAQISRGAEGNSNHIVLFVTDGRSPPWLDGTLPSLLANWSRNQTIIVLSVVDSQLWNKTVFQNANLTVGRLRWPLGPVQVAPLSAESGEIARAYLPLVSLSPKKIRRLGPLIWAEQGSETTCLRVARKTVRAQPETTLAFSPSENLGIKAFGRFIKTATPEAISIARSFASIPLFLPVMRLTQHALHASTGISHLAEVLWSGMIYRRDYQTPISSSANPNEIEFDFLPKVRDLLLDQVSVQRVSSVFDLLSQYLAQHHQFPSHFRAILDNPHGLLEWSASGLPDNRIPFARVLSHVLKRLGGEYKEVGNQLEARLQIQPNSQAHDTTEKHTQQAHSRNRDSATERTSIRHKQGVLEEMPYPFADIEVEDGTNLKKGTRYRIVRRNLPSKLYIPSKARGSKNWQEKLELFTERISSQNDQAPIRLRCVQMRIPEYPGRSKDARWLNGANSSQFWIGSMSLGTAGLLRDVNGAALIGEFPISNVTGKAVQISANQPLGYRYGFSRSYAVFGERLDQEVLRLTSQLLQELPSRLSKQIWRHWREGFPRSSFQKVETCLNALFEFGWDLELNDPLFISRFAMSSDLETRVLLTDKGHFPRIPKTTAKSQVSRIAHENGFPVEIYSEIPDVIAYMNNFLRRLVEIGGSSERQRKRKTEQSTSTATESIAGEDIELATSSQRLLSFLTSGDNEQDSDQRSQVRQILGYRREHRFDQYLVDLKDMLGSEQVRFNIRRMVATTLRQVDKPTDEELEIIEPFLFGHDLSNTLAGSIRGSIGWFDLLFSNGKLAEWLNSDDDKKVDLAIWINCRIDFHDSRSEQIAQLMSPFLGRDEAWNRRFRELFSWGIAHKSEPMWGLYLRLFELGGLDDAETNGSFRGVWAKIDNAAEEAPRRVIDLVEAWLKRTATQFDDGETKYIFEHCQSNRSDDGSHQIREAVHREPAYFLERILPLFVDIVRRTAYSLSDRLLNRAWPFLRPHLETYKIDDTILHELCRQLRWQATEKPKAFRKSIASFREDRHETFGYLILEGYSANPSEFAEECAAYLVQHQVRFYIGYGSWSGSGHGESAVSRRAVAAISPIVSGATLVKLENAIIDQCDEFEKEHPEQRGLAECLLLQEIEPRKRSPRVSDRISELKLKFPNLSTEIPSDDPEWRSGAVESPISVDRLAALSDEELIDSMGKYSGAIDTFYGGSYELSQAMSGLVLKDRVRFAELTERMPDQLDVVYFSTILDGLTGGWANQTNETQEAIDKETDRLPIDVFAKVIRRVHRLPNRPCGRSIIRTIQKLAHRDLPDELLSILEWYAVEYSDPRPNLLPEPVKGEARNGHDLYSLGINSVRGQAAEAIGSLLFADDTRWKRLQETVRRMVQDRSPVVRVCVINGLMPILNIDRGEAVRLFILCVQDSEGIWASPPFDQFLNRAIFTHFAQLHGLLIRALESDSERAVKSAATQIALADLYGIDVAGLANRVRGGTDWMRRAACHVYAHNIDKDEVDNQACQWLKTLFNDPSADVRKEIGQTFWHMSGERLVELEDFLLEFVNSESFLENGEHLLRSLEKSRVALPQVVCQAAERILELVGAGGADLRNRSALVARLISKLVVRQYAQAKQEPLKRRCLDLIDHMERMGYWGIDEELDKIDR
jgi:hypothetical protein